jgi:hypothetical protein
VVKIATFAKPQTVIGYANRLDTSTKYQTNENKNSTYNFDFANVRIWTGYKPF